MGIFRVEKKGGLVPQTIVAFYGDGSSNPTWKYRFFSREINPRRYFFYVDIGRGESKLITTDGTGTGEPIQVLVLPEEDPILKTSQRLEAIVKKFTDRLQERGNSQI